MDTHGYSAAERLERLPISGYHRIIFIIIALAFFFDSMDLAMMTFLLGSIKAEFGLSTAQAGLLASSSFFGMVLGASLSGMLADRFGRKPVFQWSIVLWGVASYLCSTAQSVDSLMLFRILLGIGMGMEFPIAQSMLSELIPATRRGRYIALMDGFWPLGFVAAGVLSYFLLPVIGWRDIFLVLAVPAVFVLVIRFFIPESPRWLEQAGRGTRRTPCSSESKTRSEPRWDVENCLNRFVCRGARARRAISFRPWRRSGHRCIASAR